MSNRWGKGPSWRQVDHTADRGFDVEGPTRRGLFEGAALALFSVLVDGSRVEPGNEQPLVLSGTDLSDLWVNYLRELLYLYNGKGFVVHHVEVERMGWKGLKAVVYGEPFSPERHPVLGEVKAVTYHQAGVERTASGWRGRFILDV
jgi:SHS2 domain-containing protein